MTNTQITAIADKAITARQLAFIVKLYSERAVAYPIPADEDLGTLTCKQASKMIGALLALPMKAAVEAPEVPEGRFAVDLNGTLRFYVVQYGKGRWEGRTFVSRQSSDNLFKISPAERAAAVKLIAADPKAATVRYGRELGVCGVCGKVLTDEESRATGIGPVCRVRRGW